MKWLIVLFGIVCVAVLSAGTALAQSRVYVPAHYRSDGTYVPSHYRTAPDDNFWNNWSTYPNVNPYTGEVGSRRYPPGYRSSRGFENLSPPVQGTGAQVGSLRLGKYQADIEASRARAEARLAERALALREQQLRLDQVSRRAALEAERRASHARLAAQHQAAPAYVPLPGYEGQSRRRSDDFPEAVRTKPRPILLDKSERWLVLARNFEVNTRPDLALQYYRKITDAYPNTNASVVAHKRMQVILIGRVADALSQVGSFLRKRALAVCMAHEPQTSRR